MAGREERYVPAGLDERRAIHEPGDLPAESPAVKQDWDGLRPVLRNRLSDELGVVLMWWRDADDPHRTRVVACGERAMCVAEPDTRDGVAVHRLDLRGWPAGSVAERAFRGPGPDPAASTRRERGAAGAGPALTVPPEVGDLLGHLPVAAQWYLQTPLAGGDGAAEGMRWYQIWDQPDRKMTAWLWLRTERAVSFAHGERVFRGTPAVAHWELRCWRVTTAHTHKPSKNR